MKKILTLLLSALFFQAVVFAQEVQPTKTAEKPSALISENNGEFSGTVRLRVTFDANGKVTNVTPLTTLPYGLTEKAIEAARNIKFVPEKINGVPVTVSKVVEYDFKIDAPKFDEKAEAVIQRAIQRLGGERYLSVKTVVGRGNFTLVKDDISGLPSAFVDYIVFPDKERTEFKIAGGKMIQTNIGDTGWIADSASRSIKDQTPEQVADFKRGIRTSLDYFLRGEWRKEKDVKLEYVGRREASLGKRNEVVRLTYADGTAIEYEFAAQDGTPAKMSYKRKNAEGAEVKEEDRFAQFVEVNGVFAPYIIDHYRDGKQSSRINYESIQYNTPVPETLFAKPTDVKKIK